MEHNKTRAKRLGERFYDGKPHKCGTTLRKTSNSACVKCYEDAKINPLKKEVSRIRGREYYNRNKKKHILSAKRCNWKRLYGITIEQYEECKRKQNGKCFICKQKKRLAIDHDHKTKKFRALLCDKCNMGLGHFNDDINLLQKSMDYLTKFRGN